MGKKHRSVGQQSLQVPEGQLDQSETNLQQGRIDQREGDLEPSGVTPRIQGGPEARGGMAGPGIGGSGVHGLQDDVNRGGPAAGPLGHSGKPGPTLGMNKSSGSKK